MDIKKKMTEMASELLRHQRLYYIDANPEISDLEYDRLIGRLLELEKKYPQFASRNSPTKRIGSDLDNSFPEREHTIPVLSLDKEYDDAGLMKWINKVIGNTGMPLGFVLEDKIDGASIVLYYQNGSLQQALTRGNGRFGNDVTENVRTIGQVPLQVDELSNFAVRGEIYINHSDFERYNRNFENKYANPRNLAAGSLRNIKSAIVARVPLQIFAYDAYFDGSEISEHVLVLKKIKDLGFRISENICFFSGDSKKNDQARHEFKGLKTSLISDLPSYLEEMKALRKSLNYEIDGLVLKVNEIAARETLGYTSHHPRWAMAYKFDAPLARTALVNIVIQVGRNGRVTPVANLEPVKLAGSEISRATLHNQEYIDILEVGLGDIVSISKRGDIIPAVEEVIDKGAGDVKVFKLPEECPFCKTKLVKVGGHHFCKNVACPERIKRSIKYFVSKNQMDIDSLGEKTIEFLYDNGYIESSADIYTFDYNRLLGTEGFKEKKVNKIIKSINSSKLQPFHRVLSALGLDGIGAKAAIELVKNGFNDVDKIIQAASAGNSKVFSDIEGFGEITAELLVSHFRDQRTLDQIAALKIAGLNFKENLYQTNNGIFHGQIWVITGSFDSFKPRSEAAKLIEAQGGRVNSTISGKTTHLLAGVAPGSKLEKARQDNIQILNESEFHELLKG